MCANSSNEWAKRERDRLLLLYGGKCALCNSKEDLQFAHKHPTPISSIARGRGRKERVIDIRRHPSAYVLLCGSRGGDVKRGCHWWFDHPEDRSP